MLSDYAKAGDNELWSTTRLQAYLANVGSPFDNGSAVCVCDTLTPAVLGELDGVYTTPAEDPAPWYDPNLPVSGEYLGFMPLSIDGIDDNPRGRAVTNAVGGGGTFGPQRDLPRTITVQGVLIGSTCCGTEYGLQYLSEALQGCSGSVCDGDCFQMYNCCPAPGLTAEQFNTQHRRTYRRTSLVSGPTVVRRDGAGGCSAGACGGTELIVVEFVIVAATPWAWTDHIPLLDVALAGASSEDCVVWCMSGSPDPVQGCGDEPCLFAPCSTPGNPCADPRNPVPTPPQPSLPPTSFCIPIAQDITCYSLDLGDRPEWSVDAPIIDVRSGSQELRNVRLTFYERRIDDARPCSEIADENRCQPSNDIFITYIPAGGSVTIDGQTGRATTQCLGECQAATTVYGDTDGGPLRINMLTCSTYCFCISVDANQPPAPDATLSLAVSGRVY